MRWLAVVGVFAALLAGLLVREVIMPRAQGYVPQFEAALTRAIGAPVRIDHLSATWQGFRLRLAAGGVRIIDAEGGVALGLDGVDATLAWSSLWRWQPYFHRLVIDTPELALQRGVDGQLRVGAIDLARARAGQGDAASRALAWALAQREVLIQQARVQWLDLMRGSAPLVAERVDFRLVSAAGRHRFGVRISPVTGVWRGVEARGDLSGLDAFDPASWNGELYLIVHELDLTAAQFWLDVPELPSAYGNLQAWLELRAGRLTAATTDLSLAELAIRPGERQPRIALTGVEGRLSFTQRDRFSIGVRDLRFALADGTRLGPLSLALDSEGPLSSLVDAGRLSADWIDLGQWAALSALLPLPDDWRSLIADSAVQGVVTGLVAQWRHPTLAHGDWRLRARLTDVRSQPVGRLPGLRGWSGSIDGTRERGRFDVAAYDASLFLPVVFPEPRLALDHVAGEGYWRYREGSYDIGIVEARFENRDAAVSVSGSYRPSVGTRGEIDLVARLRRGEANAVSRYLPKVMNPGARSWLMAALDGGQIVDAHVHLQGPLAHFPFKGDDTLGRFMVTARVSGVGLDFAPGWPRIDDIEAELRFEGAGMHIQARRATMFGTALEDVAAMIPDLVAEHGPQLAVRGRALGHTADFLRFIDRSPLQGVAGGLTGGMQVTGQGVLSLELDLPLRALTASRVSGVYDFSGNRLRLADGLPEITEARGRVVFAERSFAIPQASGRLFGEPLRVRANTGPDGRVRFSADGALSASVLSDYYPADWLTHLSGGSAWQSDLVVVDGGLDVRVVSTLEGVSSSLPHPLDKQAVQVWPSSVSLRVREAGARRALTVELGERAQLAITLDEQAGRLRLQHGSLSVPSGPVEVQQGFSTHVRLDELDLDAWLRVIEASAEGSQGWLPKWLDAGRLTASVGRLGVLGEILSEVELAAVFDSSAWRGQIASDRVAGSFDWRPAEGGVLQARLARLALGRAGDLGEIPAVRDTSVEPLRRLPALDVSVDDFVLRGRSLGSLRLEASNLGPYWYLTDLALINAAGRLGATGRWLAGSAPRTELDFRVESSDVGDLLARLGYPEAVDRGRVTLTGQAGWQGTPLRLDYPSLSGAFEVEASAGQFRRLEPGVGRLLGVLSLQSLPRRLALDFRDVFSEGFAFESVSGSIRMNRGVMHTDNLRIVGPAAKVWIAGDADLNRETQDLRVIVQPTLSESVAVGAAAGLINPVAGVVALLAQRILADPIERMFAYSYAITGTWADPRVEKLSGGAPGTTSAP